VSQRYDIVAIATLLVDFCYRKNNEVSIKELLTSDTLKNQFIMYRFLKEVSQVFPDCTAFEKNILSYLAKPHFVQLLGCYVRIFSAYSPIVWIT